MQQPVLWSANSNSFSTDHNINILGNKSYFLQVHTIQVQIVQTEILVSQTSKEKQALMLHFGQLLKSKTNKSIKNLHSLELKCKFSALFSFLIFNCCITNKQAMPHKNMSSGICGQRRSRSACTSMQSDQHLHCSLTKSLDTTESMN